MMFWNIGKLPQHTTAQTHLSHGNKHTHADAHTNMDTYVRTHTHTHTTVRVLK